MPDFGAVNITITVDNVQEITEPVSPPSGFIRLWADSTDGKLKMKRSNGDVVVIE